MVMLHDPFITLDRYFRSPYSLLARATCLICSKRGADYAGSESKRVLDLTLALPAAVASLPVVVLLALMNTLLSPRERAFFRQSRVGHDGQHIIIFKLRSMPSQLMLSSPLLPSGSCFRRFMRRHYLDELPQVWQVVAGHLSLVGIRVLPPNVYNGLARNWSPRRFARWQAAYEDASLGLSGIHQVFRVGGKQDERRFHRDVFYAEHASLGLDLYIIWRTFISLFI